MSAIKSISAALGYDACEAALAGGARLSDVYALAAMTMPSLDSAPVSGVALTLLATVRPGKKAA